MEGQEVLSTTDEESEISQFINESSTLLDLFSVVLLIVWGKESLVPRE